MRYYKIDGRRIAFNTDDSEERAILQENGLLPGSPEPEPEPEPQQDDEHIEQES